MTLRELGDKISTPYFYTYQARRLFGAEPAASLNVQLTRWVKRGELIRLKRGLYLFPKRDIDELSVASLLVSPSYVSLESALNVLGVIPDVPATVTSITTGKPKQFKTPMGVFSFAKVDTRLYFGFTITKTGGLMINIAEPEKALLDLIYLRKLKSANEYRIDTTLINALKLKHYSQRFPEWVKSAL